MNSGNDDSLGSALGASGGVDVSASRSGAGGVGGAAPSWKGRMVGHFRLLSILGQGAMGKVFRAEDVSLKRYVALKVMPQKVVQGSKTYKLDQFYREARSAATLEHPNVVTIFEVNQTSGVYYIAMELIEGGNLDDIVKGSGPLDPVRACQLCAEAAEALYYGHQHGIIHRDVKPSNLMLTRGGRCKIADFGLAHLEDPNDPFNLPTEAVGTPQYVAPEVAQSKPATALSDVYSLGATLYFLLVGRPPYVAGSKKELLRMQISAPVPDLRRDRPDLPESLAKVIGTAMAKDAGERYASADQFAKVLRTYTIPVGSMSGVHLSGSVGLVGGAGQSGAVAGSGAVGAQSGRMSGMMSGSGIVMDPAAQHRRNLMLVGGGVAVGVLLICAVFGVVSMVTGGGRGAVSSGLRGAGGNEGVGGAGGVPVAPGAAVAPAAPAPVAPAAPAPAAKAVRAPVEIPVVGEAGGGAKPQAGGGAGADGQQLGQAQQTQGLGAATAAGGAEAMAGAKPQAAGAGDGAGAKAQAGGEAGGGSRVVQHEAPAAAAAPMVTASGERVYTPEDLDALTALAGEKGSKEVVVEGVANKVETSSTGKVARITLTGPGENTFQAVYFPREFAAMEKAFGGKNGAGLVGKKVRVKGRLEVYRDEPQMVIRSAGQVSVVGGGSGKE